jgi:16S rRNA (guanine527-N7)-methyltransferase
MTSNQHNEFKSSLESLLPVFGIESLSQSQIEQLVTHYSILLQWNRRVNLTRIVEPEAAARLHYCESLFGGRFIAGAESLLDIGSGAGFPAIPLAVLRPDVRVTALEANRKKSLFLNEAKGALGLASFNVATARVEDFDLSSYDLVASRALDRAEQILPPVVSNLGRRQRLMLYCGPDLIPKMSRRIRGHYTVETHRVPQSEGRIVALFSEIGQKQAG